ncbi:MAG: metallophosphoesterase [Clostridium sp.]|nr:metallophosphoesterase [Clostridium sp.]MCM1209763.1 metallophosphoesterase [Ruminococcus sp.]
MKKSKKRYIIVICVIVFLVGFCYWQNNMLVLSEYEYANEKITKEMDGFTIVHLSDLHNKGFGKNQKRLIKKIEECEPDMIVITGDLVDERSKNFDKAAALVRNAASIAPVYYVTGNHEKWLSDDLYNALMDMLRQEGVTILDNTYLSIEKGDSDFILAGLDDGSLLDDTLKELRLNDKTELVVLLTHEPQYIKDYSIYGADLVLAGHAHGGQFRLPFIGGVYAPDQGFHPAYTSGVYEENDTAMVVSRGLGNSVIPVRLFNFPDIVCVRFKAGQ